MLRVNNCKVNEAIDEIRMGSKQCIAYQQSHKVYVFVEGVLICIDGDPAQLHLLLLALDPGRQQPVDPEGLTLLDSERHSLQTKITKH